MRANRITVGTVVAIDHGGTEVPPAVVVDTEHDGNMVALRLRQEGKRRSCWVAVPATEPVKTLRR